MGFCWSMRATHYRTTIDPGKRRPILANLGGILRGSDFARMRSLRLERKRPGDRVGYRAGVASHPAPTRRGEQWRTIA
jgi:hypothetical protein